jgi:hypothetical protein
MVQFCTWEEGLGGVKIESRGRGISLGLASHIGLSTSGQSIFLGHLGLKGETAAALVTIGRVGIPSTPDSYQYAFLTGKSSYPSAQWSSWVPPDFVTQDREAQFKILGGHMVSKVANPQIRVLARYKLASLNNFMKEIDGVGLPGGQKAGLEACPLPARESVGDAA